MKAKWDGIERRKSLRSQAESLVESLSEGNGTNPTEILMHELLVHKVELEMQNEELRRANIEIEEARDHYKNLYELAPIGYLMINGKGLVNTVNLTGATLLGMSRDKLINRRFSTFVADQDKDRWHILLMSMMKLSDGAQLGFNMQMKRNDGFQFTGYLHCVHKKTLDELAILQVALTDLTQRTATPEPPQ